VPKPISAIYVHFLDWYHFRRAREENGQNPKVIEEEAKLALRFAMIFSDRVVVPASSFFEGNICLKLIREHEPFRSGGILQVASPDGSLREHLERKQASYNWSSPRGLMNAYRRFRTGAPRFIKKQQPTTPSLVEHWLSVPDRTDLTTFLKEGSSEQAKQELKAIWNEVPQLLGNQAFVPSHIEEIFARRSIYFGSRTTLHEIIEPAYVGSYAQEFGLSLVTDLVVLEPPFKFGVSNRPSLSYSKVLQRLVGLNLDVAIKTASAEALWRASRLSEWDELATRILADDTSASMNELPNVVRRRLMEEIEETHREPPDFGYSTGPTNRSALTQPAQSSTTNGPSTARAVNSMPKKLEIFAAIICAVEVEFGALRDLLPPSGGLRDNGNEYEAYLPGSKDVVMVSLLPKKGNNSSAVETTRILLQYQPAVLFLVGITGGFDGDRRLGDVIVADQVIAYEAAKVKDQTIEYRPEAYRASVALVAAAANTARSGAWRDRITVARPKSKHLQPEVHVATVLSGEKVVASKKFLTEFKDLWTTIAGVEMEGAGAALAAYRNEAQPEFLMVKGICDWADKDKDDGWQGYAADVAGAFVITLLRGLVDGDNPRPNRPAPPNTERLSDAERLDIYERIGEDWNRLADYFDVRASDRSSFPAGRGPQALWQYLKQRDELARLPQALIAIRREDIVRRFPDLAARLENEPL
jgi:nucleoside phosphorylase